MIQLKGSYKNIGSLTFACLILLVIGMFTLPGLIYKNEISFFLIFSCVIGFVGFIPIGYQLAQKADIKAGFLIPVAVLLSLIIPVGAIASYTIAVG